jgi:hypothetical protein
MIWGLIKLTVFVGLAVLSGVLCATVPVGGRTIASRATELWGKPEVKSAVGDVQSRAKRGVEAALRTPSVRDDGSRPMPVPSPAPHETRIDPRKVATVVADTPPGDRFAPSERQAVQQIIQQRARQPAHRPGH